MSMFSPDELRRLESAIHGGHTIGFGGQHDEESCDECQRKRRRVAAASVSAGCVVTVVFVAVCLVGWSAVCQWVGLTWKWALPLLVAAGAALVFLIAYALALVTDSAAAGASVGCLVIVLSIAMYLAGPSAVRQSIGLTRTWALPVLTAVGAAVLSLIAYALAAVGDSSDSGLAQLAAVILCILAIMLLMKAAAALGLVALLLFMVVVVGIGVLCALVGS